MIEEGTIRYSFSVKLCKVADEHISKSKYPMQGQRITLRPATLEDREVIYQWLADSDITHLMLGPPDFPDSPVPTWEEFVNDYAEHYFNDKEPLKGRCFIIEHERTPVGQVSYNEIFKDERTTELDIWLAGSHVTGKGYGSDALAALCDYLHRAFECARFIIAPSAKNVQAILAYRKAGFNPTEDIPSWFVADYEETLVMSKEIPAKTR